MEPFEEEEEGSREIHPPLPPNYVSLAQLREQWLQKQILEERKEFREQEQKQPEREGKKPIIASQGQRSEKGKEKFHEKEQGRERNERRRVEGQQKVYVGKRELGGNRPGSGGAQTHLKYEEVRARAPTDRGVDGVGGMEETVGGWKSKKKNGNRRVNRANRNLIGVHKNEENSGDLSWENGGEDKCGPEFGRNGDEAREEKKVTVCKEGVGFVPENKGKEVLGMGGKRGGAKGFRKQEWGDTVNVCRVELLPENGSEVEVPVAGDGVDQGMLESEIVCKAKVLPESKVEGDCSFNVGRKNGKGRYRDWSKRNVDNWGKWRDSRDSTDEMELGCKKNVVEQRGVVVKENKRNDVSVDSKMELGCQKNVIDEGVLVKENDGNGVQKERTARRIQAYEDDKIVQGNLSTTISKDLRSLSLDDNRKENVTWRNGPRRSNNRRRFEKPRYVNGLVWVKKGEISDTNADKNL